MLMPMLKTGIMKWAGSCGPARVGRLEEGRPVVGLAQGLAVRASAGKAADMTIRTDADSPCRARRGVRHRAGVTLSSTFLVMTGITGITVAGVDQLRVFECNIGHKGVNDTEYQFGESAFCDPDTQGCVSTGEDTNGDGRIDRVVNICLPRRFI